METKAFEFVATPVNISVGYGSLKDDAAFAAAATLFKEIGADSPQQGISVLSIDETEVLAVIVLLVMVSGKLRYMVLKDDRSYYVAECDEGLEWNLRQTAYDTPPGFTGEVTDFDVLRLLSD